MCVLVRRHSYLPLLHLQNWEWLDKLEDGQRTWSELCNQEMVYSCSEKIYLAFLILCMCLKFSETPQITRLHPSVLKAFYYWEQAHKYTNTYSALTKAFFRKIYQNN